MSSNPVNPKSDPPTARGIILVEQYTALGIAIAAALKKFAPLYALRVVQSLEEADEAAEPMQPELFILDLDPPQRGQVEFLDRLRTHYPAARVLVIAAGTSRELVAARRSSGALQYIEKPFELGEFGASVQALLGPWAAASGDQFRGTLRNLDLLDIAQLQCLAFRTAVVRLETPAGKKGDIYFRKGEISHAIAGKRTGLAALEEIVRWPAGKFSETEAPDEAPQTINQPWAALLLDLSRNVERETIKPLEQTPARPTAPTHPSKTILVIDDTEMLLIFAADVLATADPTFEVITASTGGEGLLLAAAKRPDLILLDYSLTDINGDEVCRGLLGNEMTSRIPVLLMSGHLPELTRTAHTYTNVVATLAKPFLSGALIDCVEKLLAAGPLAAAPLPQPIVQPEASSSAIVSPPASPNGHGMGSNGGYTIASESESPMPPTASLLFAPPEFETVFPSRQTSSAFSTGLATETREVTATLACEVISVQLAPDFRMGALQLKPAEAIVVVQMNGANVLAPEKDFLLGPTSLTADGKIDQIRLIPTSKSMHVAPSAGDFAVDRVSAPLTSEGRFVELTAAPSAAMRVQLIAQFELLAVDLAETFEVAHVVLQSHSNSVRVQTGNNGSVAMQFFIHDIQLDQAQLLTGLTVGSRN